MPRKLGAALGAAAAVIAAAAWLASRKPPIPQRTLLIGYQHNPPYQLHRPGRRPTGLSVETVAEAARRAAIPIEWREVPAGPDVALPAGAVDLWPLLTHMRDRRSTLYISAPWLRAQHAVVIAAGRAVPGTDFAERVATTAIPVHVRRAGDYFPLAELVERPEGRDVLLEVCNGGAEAAFLESRLALAVLREQPPQCADAELRAHVLPGAYELGVGSTFESARAADRLREQISEMAADGTLAVLLARHSFFGLSDTRATYDLLEAEGRNRRLLWVIGGLSLALGLALWGAWSLRSARRAAELARGDLERAVRELERRNAELERFNYTVSHDLRSPLVTAAGFLGSVERAALEGDEKRLRLDLGRVRSAIERMDLLLKELLELSRVEHTFVEPETVPLAEVVSEALSRVDGRLRNRNVQVEVARDLPSVSGSRERLTEAVQNLLDNAAKFMGDQERPRIEVLARRDAGEAVVIVKDNGKGIEARYHEKVFGLFDRLDPTEEGTGVGLALVKRIVEAHGGRVWVESEGQGKGASFCLTLPPAETRPRP